MTLQTSTPKPSPPQQLELFPGDDAAGRSRSSSTRTSWSKFAAVLPLALLVGGVALRTNAFSPSAEPQASVTVRPLPVDTLRVSLSESYETQRTYTGDIEARRSSELGFEQSGLVVRVLVEEGDRVAANQVIAELDTQRLLAQRQELLAQKAQAEADLTEVIAGPRSEDIASAQANVRDIEAQLQLAQQRYQRRLNLQQEGVINDILVWIGLVADDGRLALINNQTGTIIAMTHILLPFMILPLYSVMKTIPPSYVRAAKSLGATNWTAFWRVYFPQSIPGIGAGCILVFILSIGYYITPELVGGRTGTFISNRIAFHISESLNWGLAAALGSILLALVLVLYWLYDRMVGIDNVKLG